MTGVHPVSALVTLQALGADAFGCNCSTGPDDMAKVISLMYPYAKIPLIAKPNAGLPKFENGRTVFPMGAQEFADFVPELLSAGASILGGCCGTDHNVIKALREMIDENANAVVDAPYDIEATALYAVNSRVCTIVDTNGLPNPLTVDEDLTDNAEEMADDYEFIYLRLETEDDVDTVLEAVPFFSLPIAVCGNENAIALLKKYYCGKLAVIRDNA